MRIGHTTQEGGEITAEAHPWIGSPWLQTQGELFRLTVIKETNGKSTRRPIPDPKARMKSDNPTGCEHETSRVSNKAAGSTDGGSHVWKTAGPCLVQLNMSIS